MAWFAEATKLPIQPGSNDPPIKVIGAILHVDAGNNKSLYEYFKNDSGGIESHFHVPKEGPVQQYRDTAYEADANLKANSFLDTSDVRIVRKGYVSIETQGRAAGEWNPHQLDNIKRLLKWLSETHDFPLRVCTSPASPGIGYHVMFGAPGPWTPRAKVCPGPDRVRQFHDELVPWMARETGTEDEMTPAQMQELKEYFESRIQAYTKDLKKYDSQTNDDDAKRAADAVKAALAPSLDKLSNAVSSNTAAVKAMVKQ